MSAGDPKTAPERWRFTSAGVTRVVAVNDTGRPGTLRYEVDGAAEFHGLTPNDAIARYATATRAFLEVTEILAPGEPTRAELQARIRDLESTLRSAPEPRRRVIVIVEEPPCE